MAKKEAQTDLWVYDLLKEANINLTYQGSDIKELNEALSNASKKGTFFINNFTKLINLFSVFYHGKLC